ncbi:MAG: hypothetical protein LBT53_04935, partial [Puniceicoccales bacterium]|nr:hypothetical protein [Puniceicoccales bacterium]
MRLKMVGVMKTPMLLGALLCATTLTLAPPRLRAEVEIKDSFVSNWSEGSVKLRFATLTITSPAIAKAISEVGTTVEIADLPPSLARPKVRVVTLSPGNPAANAPDDGIRTPHLQIYALLRDPAAKEAVVKINFRDKTGKVTGTESVRWNLAAAKKPATSPSGSWHNAHLSGIEALGTPDSDDPIFAVWRDSSKALYGDYYTSPFGGRGTSRAQTRRTSDLGAMSVLGGRTAITETLQTQLIAASGGEKDGTGRVLERVSVATVTGVEVKAHPYAKMAADLKLPPLAPSAAATLADYAPADRLFAHIREPRALAAIWDGSDDAVSRVAPLLGGGFSDYDLLARCTARFGLTPKAARAWFSGGNVAELALIAPDVFFRDSTDFTLIIRPKPNAPTPFAFLKKVPGPLAVPLPNGETFWFAARDGLLFLSTHGDELTRTLARKTPLARTDEFRVMSAKLPQTSDTRAYVYFSDAFIRRLTGPEVKIGQFRRANTRAILTRLTALAMLHRRDQGTEPASIADLKRKGYLDTDAPLEDEFSLRPGCIAVSNKWGTLARLKTLLENPATTVTTDEVRAYERYRDNYA